MAFLEKAEKQDLILLAKDLGLRVSDKMTVIDLKNIIIGSKDNEEEFVEAYLCVISEERVERGKEEKIAKQHAIEQQRKTHEFELEKLRLESELHNSVKGEQEMVNAAIDTGAQMPVVRADVVEGQSIDNRGSIQITSALGEHEMGELKGTNMEMNDLRHDVVPVSKNLVNDMLICSSDYEGLIENSQLVRNPAILREPSKEEGIINSVSSKSVCSQEVVTDLLPETYTQSLLKVPNGDLVAVKINASNVQTNGQGIKESKRRVALSVDSLHSENI
ncbi:hypothetical protein TNCV_2103951 [Trichonephila clavipes]|nr:hypothetical protein TNCV_2103951 [Trichonephila clavipes]